MDDHAMMNESGVIIRRDKKRYKILLTQRNEKGRTMRKTHVNGLPLGAIIFVLLLIGGVFPSMAQAVDLTINFVGSGRGRVDGSDVPGTGPFFIFNSQTISYDLVQPPSSVTLTATPTGLGASQSTFAGWTGCASTSGNQCTVVY